MSRLAIPILAAALLAASGCGDSPCQKLGEKICNCQPGMTADTCTAQVKDQVDAIDPTSSFEEYCQVRLDHCNNDLPAGADFCEWLLTTEGKDQCGLSPRNPPEP